ncbi:MAG: hypothetical protein R3D68_04460 [Hyphomicrobiaceae bacterium]
MSHQVLWIELVLKLSAGLVLLLAPRLLARVLGLARVDDPFWPRLLGTMLLGLAVAFALEAKVQPGKVIGTLGAASVNLALAAGLGTLLILTGIAPTRRAKMFLWISAALMMLLGLIEIVFAA